MQHIPTTRAIYTKRMCNIYQPHVKRIKSIYLSNMPKQVNVSLHCYMFLICGVYVPHMRAAYVSQPVRSYFVKIELYFGPDTNSVANTAQTKHLKITSSTQTPRKTNICAVFALRMRVLCASFAYRLRIVCVVFA